MSLIISAMIAAQSFMFWSVVILGACVGSFLNVCIIRIPQKTFFKHIRSVCPSCGAVVPSYLNIPVFSFFILRGKAKCCGVKLSWQYPLVEIAAAFIFAFVYFKFPFAGWSLNGASYSAPDFIRYCHASIFISLILLAKFRIVLNFTTYQN